VKWKDFDVEIPDRETARSVRDALLTMELERTAGRIMTLTEKINDAVNDAERKRTVHQIQQLIEQREELRKHFEQEPTDTTWRSPDRTSVS
jgi:ribosomal protein S15P/S13E